MSKRIQQAKHNGRRIRPARLLTSVSLPALALITLPTTAQAQSTVYWDGGTANGGNPAPDANGGNGTWNTTTTNWDTATTSGDPVAWTSGDNAVFGGTAGSVNVGAPIIIGNLTFNVPGYTLTGNTLTFQGANPTIALAGAGGNTTINSVIAGSNGLRIDGGGSTNRILTLGATNTLTGGITLNSGRLVAAAANALNGSSNVVTINNGAALQINHSNAFGGNTAAANLVMNNGANLWLANQNLTHDITANGGTIVIADVVGSGNSTWTGNLILTADTRLLVTNTGANDNLFFAGNLTDTGANRLSLELNEGGNLDSNLQLTGTNSFTGGILVNSGQLIATGTDSLGGAAGNVVTVNGGILRASGNAFGGDTDAAQLILNGGVLRVETSQTLNHDVTLTGGVATIDGVGNATWIGTPVLTASTLLRLGVGGHTLNVRGPLQDTGANVLSVTTQGGEVRFNGSLGFSGDLTLVSGNTWFDGGTYTYSGDTIISSNARLLLNSTSMSPNSNIRFEGLNNGHLTVIYGTTARPAITMANGPGGGELRWTGTGGFYALANQSDVTVNLGDAGATLTWNDGLFVPDGHALILGTNGTGGAARQVDFQNGIDLSGGLRQVRADAGSIADHAVLSGALTGTGGLHVIGDGLLELTNAGNNYSGATVVGDAATGRVGNLLLGASGALSPNSNLQINGTSSPNLIQHGGYVLLNVASGPFTRAVGTGAGQIQWTASGGFGAIGAPQTVNLGGASATLVWGSGGFVPTGHALRFGGNWANSTINWQNGIDLGAADRVINVNEGQGDGYVNTSQLEVNLNGVIQGTGGLVLNGVGDVALNALNTYGGTTWIGGTSVAGGSDGSWAWANTLANTGTASSLGAGSTVVLSSHVGGLVYTGGATSTDRTLALNRTGGAVHHLFNYGSGPLTWTGNITTTGSGVNHLRLGGTYATTTDASGVAVAPNVISGVISDGTGVTRIRGWTSGSCTTGGVWRLTGANTFTGEVAPDGCVIEATTIGNAGAASAVGAGDLVVDFRSSDGTLRYIGSGETSDRSFWAWGNSHLESSGTGPLDLTNTGIIVSQNGSFTHYLGGSNTGDNRLAATLVDSPTPVEFGASWFRLAKDGPGLWALTANNNAQLNAYTGMTRIFGGALRLDHAGAITGGLGVSSSHGAAGSSQRSSLIRFEGAADGTGGVIGLTAASGGFFRGLTTAGDAFVNNNGTTIGADPDGVGPLPAYGVEALDDDNYVQGVRWISSGGFAAWDGTQVVNIGGSATPATLTWNTGGFVPTGHNLVLGYVTANGTVDFQNGIGLTNAARTIQVADGTAAVDAILSGVLTSTTTAGALNKTGAGTLALTNANTYTGVTTINAGTLQIGNAGSTGTLGGGNVTVAAGANLAFARSDTGHVVANQITGAGTLIQRGTGTTTLTSATNDIGATAVNAGTLQVNGTLTTPTVAMTGTSALTVNGTVGATAGGIATFTGDAGASTINVAAAGTLRGMGDLGGGSDVVNLTGTLNTGAGTLSLGAGDDTLALNDTGVLTGSVLGGTGTDTLQVNNAAARTLAGSQLGGFESLAKTLGGTLLLTGTHDYANSVSVAAGLLQVDGTVTTQAIALAGGSAFTVNGTAQAAGGTAAMITGDAGVNTVTVTAGSTLRARGDLGDGTDFVILTGTLDTGAGTLSLGDGDDNFALTDSAVLTGGVVGGSGIDTLRVNSAADRTLTTAQVSGFEALHKTLAGTLTLTGDHSYANGVAIVAGTLQIGDGTATGTLVGNVANAGTLTFNRAGASTYAGVISGAGVVNHDGSGTTTFTGANAYGGATNVNAGTLLVNGNQSAATGLTSVASGATLGGDGTIGGSVNVADGGILAAGSNGVGALTINGNLALANASQVNFEFGQANVVGGSLNDLVNVGGNLTLDGVLNVTQSPGGTFGPGVYRMFNYSGALTNNGLNVASPDYFVQTSVANQVNLVNSAGLSLSFWDGDAGPRNNEIVDGGNGTWRAAGDQNWTDVSGLFAAPFANASFAIFQGAAGTVAVDNTNGAIQAVGMQFATDGYVVQGGDLVLVDDGGQAGLQSIVRVGDGTAASPGYTATIASNLSGATQLVKTDAGTLVLTGTNSYTGGTAINGGTLQISSNANLGDAAGGLSFNGGTLSTAANITTMRNVNLVGAGTFDVDTGTMLTLSGALSGAGALAKEGDGFLILAGNSAHTGGTRVDAGVLQVGFGTIGTLSGDVLNNAQLAFARSDDVVFGGTISGTGSLSQIGGSILTLTADNSYTGVSNVIAGTLQLGNGGTTGSIAGDVVNSGTLIFNRSNEYSFAGTISGAGDVRQEGTGTTILTAANSYTGSTIISRGTLLINGNQAAAIGATHVLGGGTLGGTGTIGGDVFVGGAATLTPGDATGPGTLTINGNLGFSPNATLAYDFGQSNVVGGPLNDHVDVAGHLTLDGTIDVTLAPGGSFGPGLYRIISYGGVLTNNGLAIGTMPVGSTVAVQTSIGGQVNLVNAAGATFNFWDGAAPASESNNFVDGGSGTWQNSSGNNDWTTATGIVSGAYSDGAFAIFAAAAGTVSIDNSLGAVTASGLQFASDGYTIDGQNLTLVGPESVIRVGDGTAAGLGMTATIDARIFGATQLVKADLGTLVLTRSNTYTGGTRIDAGTLRISSDASLGDAAGALSLNSGTLNTIAAMASGRAVNLLGTGTLSTDAGTSLTLFGSVSGVGGFTKAGTGILTLTGNNSFGGDVEVTAGQMFVNGDQSAATGATRVASGATLSGSGIIGGNVALADGATLDPGGALFGVGTLEIEGDLALSSGSALNFQFGEANVAGGALNDLINVGGDLTLDGTINVLIPTGGSFGPGIYRVFNYGGTLTDNGLALGALPGGSAVSVQTAVAGQVNLVNTAGLTLSFWDGDGGPKNNGAVNGGNGVWRAAGGLNNWTDSAGSLNADYAQDSFAIFSAAPGTVTVDNVDGAVRASGMQFASNGYVVAGGPLTLTGTQAIVQVGDGSAASASFTATVAAELAGTARLVKTDAGRLILTGANSYTGGTTIDGGTLQIGNGAATGSIVGDIVNNAALVVNRTGTLSLDGAISGSGSLTKTGSGTLILTGTNSYAGGTTVSGGTVRISSDANLGDVAGVLSLQGGTLQAGASFTSARDMLVGSPTANRIDTQGFDVTLTGTIGNGANNQAGNLLDKIGSGTLTLTGANIYANRTVISGGTLALAGAGTAGVGNIIIGAGTVFDISQTNTGARVIQLNSGPAGTIALGSKMLTLGLENTFSDWSGTITDGGIAGGTGGRVVIGGVGGAVRFLEANSYTGGTTVLSGSFELVGNGSLYSGGAVTVVTGGTFSIAGLAGPGTTIGDLSGSGSGSGSGAVVLGSKTLTFGTANDTYFSGTISGGGALIKQGTGTFTLTGTGSHTGGTTIAAGTLQIGSGGVSGSITGDIVNNGMLTFNRSNAMTFDGMISGVGALHQFGSGTTILTGANSYAGDTTVSAGTLLVNGNQSLATGLTNALGGATLGGTGTIGGDVFVGGGATLAPGSGGVGTLTINGDLGFSPNATLAFEFGQANVPGGALNDLINVGGNLTLGGTIDVTQSAGGSFGPGLYRIVNYAGTLTNNGLTVGTMPAGSQAFVQTVVPGQVNLVNTAGLTLGFWDGAAGSKNDGAIQGGVGTWRVGGGENNWTEVFGAVNADYAQDSFAIFSGLGGTVTIDNGNGNVRAAGMQFAVNGYTLMGGPLELTGADAFVRVGDGSAGDAAITATIASALTGSARLVKDMGGTLILTRANSYTGGTAINGGTLDVSSDANLGDAAGGLSFNGGTLDITTTFGSSRTVDLVGTGTFRTQGTGFTLRGAVSGAGALVKEGNGTVTLTADNSYTGGTTINAGVLNLGEGGTTGSILGNIVNNGRFAINRSNMYTLTGTISGGGELFQMGSGTTILTAANSYTGATRVSAGTLLINGDQSAATGLTSLAANATLGGTGTIGGDVRLGNGTLAPGAGGAGTLTINGDLTMVAGSRLAVDFGAANAVGSPLNDLVNVGGNLTLDGTIDIAVTPGGAFDIGLYRIANYAGALTNNGLAIGTMPAGAELAVQTSILGQVNLVNTGSAVLNFWDGNTGPKFNGAVNGGSGVWWATGTDNWTDMTGAVNAAYDNGAFAVFAGASGLVTIDNSQGAVTASGLQFAATGGYVIQGGALTLTGPQSVIRVGDGTSAGLGYSAIIASGIIGNTQLIKTDLGRLVLAGVNSYTGGTAINGGTVRISSDANLGAASGGLSFNGGTLNTTADISSARAVDLAGQGVFSTDAGTTLTLSGNLTGTGLIGKLGAGTLVLAGTGSHTGGMGVVQGTLLVNGNYAAATGPLTMNPVATLGGTGTIGGNVNLSGTLAPGANGVGTLTINGDLLISHSTTLAYEFGQANVAGGTLNDLVNVGGDLTLDGTINVTVPAGGAFDVGVYRVFNYGGTLTDNGLTLGAVPGGNVAVQTSIAGQVNLVNSAGLSLAFWDGGAGPKNNGVINGGTGTWQSSGGNDNWADASGAVNAAYSDGAFAVFGGTGGTVTVDNSLGQVTAGGMQFAANGYTLTGGSVALTAPQSTIRVGDGSTAGAGFTATVNAALSGDTQLVKTDAGTLILAGLNTYTGGTRVTGGTLQISADANLGAADGDVTLDGGTLATSANMTSARDVVMAGAGTIATAGGTTFTLNGVLSGSGALSKTGAGTLVLTGDSSGYTGSTQVTGMLTVNGSLCGDVNVLAGGRVGGTGTICTTVNAGTIAPGNSIGTLTIAGSYTGNSGTLEIETVLGGDASPTDRLVVTGGTSGTTQVNVINQDGLGAQTVEGIKIVDVTGGISAGTFTLNGDYDFHGSPAVIAGAYGYRLFQGGVSTPTDGDWYLRSALLVAPNEPQVPLYQPGVPVYEAYNQALLALTDLGTLQQRIGNRQWAHADSGQPSGIWGRMQSNRSRANAAFSTSMSEVNIDSWKIELGADHVLSERGDGATLVLGVLGGYGEANASIGSIYGSGSIKAKSYSAGATLTWFGPDGFYVDGRAQVTWFDSKLNSAVLGKLADDNKGTGQAYSVEIGKRAPIGQTLGITPQIQMVYSTVGFDRFTDPNDAAVSSKLGDSMKTRWGLSIDRQDGRSHLYGVVNLSYEWLDGTITDVSGTRIARENHRLWGEVGVGGSLKLGGRLTLYTEALADTAINDFGNSYSLKATAGLRLAF